jgi:hypothetical protein
MGSGHRVQVGLLDRKRRMTRIERATALFEYLEVFNNCQRRHSSLSVITPVEYEFHHGATSAG